MIYAAMFKSDGRVYMCLNEDGSIRGFRSLQEGVDAFKAPYDRSSARGYEGSMSALIHRITFQPRIVAAPAAESLKGAVVADGARATRVSNVSGSMLGAPCDGPGAAALYESGVSP